MSNPFSSYFPLSLRAVIPTVAVSLSAGCATISNAPETPKTPLSFADDCVAYDQYKGLTTFDEICVVQKREASKREFAIRRQLFELNSLTNLADQVCLQSQKNLGLQRVCLYETVSVAEQLGRVQAKNPDVYARLINGEGYRSATDFVRRSLDSGFSCQFVGSTIASKEAWNCAPGELNGDVATATDTASPAVITRKEGAQVVAQARGGSAIPRSTRTLEKQNLLRVPLKNIKAGNIDHIPQQGVFETNYGQSPDRINAQSTKSPDIKSLLAGNIQRTLSTEFLNTGNSLRAGIIASALISGRLPKPPPRLPPELPPLASVPYNPFSRYAIANKKAIKLRKKQKRLALREKIKSLRNRDLYSSNFIRDTELPNRGQKFKGWFIENRLSMGAGMVSGGIVRAFGIAALALTLPAATVAAAPTALLVGSAMGLGLLSGGVAELVRVRVKEGSWKVDAFAKGASIGAVFGGLGLAVAHGVGIASHAVSLNSFWHHFMPGSNGAAHAAHASVSAINSAPLDHVTQVNSGISAPAPQVAPLPSLNDVMSSDQVKHLSKPMREAAKSLMNNHSASDLVNWAKQASYDLISHGHKDIAYDVMKHGTDIANQLNVHGHVVEQLNRDIGYFEIQKLGGHYNFASGIDHLKSAGNLGLKLLSSLKL